MTRRRRTRRGRAILTASAAIAALMITGSARGATVTVGSPLSAPPSMFFGGTATEANVTLGEPGAIATAPDNGVVERWTIVSYRVDVFGTGRVAIRALRHAGGGAFTGVGSSPPATPVGTGLQTFDANLPIRPGDMVGLDLLDPSSSVRVASVTGSTIDEWGNNGFLADGDTALPKNIYGSREIAFNAQLKPTNEFVVGSVRKNRRKGTGTVSLKLPNPGNLTASGKGARVTAARGASISKPVAAGPAKLLVEATGRKRRALNQTGSAKVRLSITFTPKLGGPRTETAKVKLKQA